MSYGHALAARDSGTLTEFTINFAQLLRVIKYNCISSLR